MAFLFRHYSDIDVTPSRLDLGLFTKEDQAAPQAVAARAPGMPADPAGRSASRDRSAVARAAVSPGGGVTLRLCGGHAAFLTAGRAPAPCSATNVTKGWLVTPQDLSPRKPDAVSRTRGPSGGSWRPCRGQGNAGESESCTSAGRLRRRLGAAGRVHQILAQTGGRVTCSPRPSEKPPGPPPQPPPASPTLVLSTRLPTEPRGERLLPRLSPARPGGKGGPAHAARCRAALGWDRRVPVGVCGEF